MPVTPKRAISGHGPLGADTGNALDPSWSEAARPLATPSHKGVDLSHHNDLVDFGTLKAGGIEFVALKATQGAGYVDPTFADRQARARAVAFDHVLFYHFFDPTFNATDQGAHFAETVGWLNPGELIVVDVEQTGGWGRLTAEQSAEAIREFVASAKGCLAATDDRVVVYGSLGWLRGQFGVSLVRLTAWNLWAARYAPQLGDTSPWPRALLWQDSESGSVAGAGAPGTVDLDVWLDPEAWA